jgi:hypothetical protein
VRVVEEEDDDDKGDAHQHPDNGEGEMLLLKRMYHLDNSRQ